MKNLNKSLGTEGSMVLSKRIQIETSSNIKEEFSSEMSVIQNHFLTQNAQCFDENTELLGLNNNEME